MKWVICAWALVSAPVIGEAGDLVIDLKVDRQSVTKIHLQFDEGMATAIVAGEKERFNLQEMSWLHDGTGKWVTLAQCEAWAQQSKARTKQGIDSAPEEMRSFLRWSLDPSFTTENSKNTIRLISGQVDYVIVLLASKAGMDGYFRYATLNAYKKAMLERKIPPFAELKVLAEIKALGRMPSNMDVTIPGIPGAPGFSYTITESP